MVMKYSVGFVKNLIIHILGESTSTMVMKYSVEARHNRSTSIPVVARYQLTRSATNIFVLFCFGVQCVANVLKI